MVFVQMWEENVQEIKTFILLGHQNKAVPHSLPCPIQAACSYRLVQNYTRLRRVDYREFM